MLLCIGAKAGLSLYSIGRIMYRGDYNNNASELEVIIEKAENLYTDIVFR